MMAAKRHKRKGSRLSEKSGGRVSKEQGIRKKYEGQISNIEHSTSNSEQLNKECEGRRWGDEKKNHRRKCLQFGGKFIIDKPDRVSTDETEEGL